MSVSPSRKSAFEVLMKVEKREGNSSELLDAYESRLSRKDAALCHEIVLGTLRYKYLLDHLLSGLTDRKIGSLDAEVLAASRIGIYQLRFLERIPPHSIVNESVNLVAAAGKRSARGFVNAILRRSVREPRLLEGLEESADICVRESHPAWLFDRWSRQFGRGAAEEILRFNNRRPGVSFRFTQRFDELPEKNREQLTDDLLTDPAISRSNSVSGAYVADRLTGGLRTLFETGLVYLQEEGSILTAAAVPEFGNGRILDLCAAPGSKTGQIIRNARGDGTVVLAGDLSRGRLRTTRRLLAAQGARSVLFAAYDAETALPFEDSVFDSVLADVPCTGTGTIARNPEIRYRLNEADPARFGEKQLRILRLASNVVKPGGSLIYSTCSLEREENEAVVDGFLSSDKRYEKADSAALAPFATSGGTYRTLPQAHGMDGFFIAVLARRN